MLFKGNSNFIKLALRSRQKKAILKYYLYFAIRLSYQLLCWKKQLLVAN